MHWDGEEREIATLFIYLYKVSSVCMVLRRKQNGTGLSSEQFIIKHLTKENKRERSRVEGKGKGNAYAIQSILFHIQANLHLQQRCL